MIRAYFEETPGRWDVDFVEEDKPLGTVGAIAKISDALTSPFMLTNCDIMILADYGKIYEHHVARGLDITIVTSAMQYSIPYGVCEVASEGELLQLTEKPQLDLLVNTGMYVLSPHVLSRIPSDQTFDATDLIRAVMERGDKVGVYPVSEGSWLDVGQWEEYQKTVKALN